MSTVLNVASHAVDLHDGRTIAPGESADIDIKIEHNARLVAAGLILVEAAAPAEVKSPQGKPREDEKS